MFPRKLATRIVHYSLACEKRSCKQVTFAKESECLLPVANSGNEMCLKDNVLSSPRLLLLTIKWVKISLGG